MPISPKKERILVVDDSATTLEVLQRNLAAAEYQVFTTQGVPEAIEILKGTQIDLVITDLKMPSVSGLDLIRHIRENFKDTEVMMITGYPSIEGAVTAVKTGAEEFIAKPFTDDELLCAVRRALDKLKEAHKSQDIAAIDKAMEEMNAAWQNASQEMYAASGAENAGQTGGSQAGAEAPHSDGGDDSGVSDVEYEEVDDKKK